MAWVREYSPWFGLGLIGLIVAAAGGGLLVGVLVGRRLEPLGLGELAWPECSVYVKLLVVPLVVGLAFAATVIGPLLRTGARPALSASRLGWGTAVAAVVVAVFWVVASAVAAPMSERGSRWVTEASDESLAHYGVYLAPPDSAVVSFLSAVAFAAAVSMALVFAIRRGAAAGVLTPVRAVVLVMITCTAVFGIVFSVHATYAKHTWQREVTEPAHTW